MNLSYLRLFWKAFIQGLTLQGLTWIGKPLGEIPSPCLPPKVLKYTVGALDPKLKFVSDLREVARIKRTFASPHLTNPAADFDSFFVDSQDGEYTEVWGMYGTTPYLRNPVHRIL